MRVRRTHRSVLAVGSASTLALVAAGCGGSTSEVGGGNDPVVTESHEADDPGHTAEHPTLNEPDATPADQLTGAQVRQGTFEVLDTAPPETGDVTGKAWIAVNDAGTTVTARLQELEPGNEYLLHLHTKPCSTDAGGPHFKFDPEGSDQPPNEIHLLMTAEADGDGAATVTSDQQVGDDAQSIVIHPSDAMDNRIACAGF